LPASPYSSVQKAREQLAARLVEIRKDAGLNSRQLAGRLGWYESKISRIVNAITPPSEDDIRAWCDACEAPGEAPGLIAALRLAQGAYVEWRRMERHGLRAAQESVWALYERTKLYRFYTSCVLMGLAQTSGYTQAVLQNVQERRGLADDIPDAVQVRMDRQRVLDDPRRTFVFLIEEPVLRTQVAEPDVMAEQLGYLLHLATRPNVSLGIIPWTLRRRYPPSEAFFMHDREQVAVEMIGAYLSITEPSEVALYEQAFEELSCLAAWDATTIRKLIAAAIEALG